MGQTSGKFVAQCIGQEVAEVFVKNLAGKSVEDVKAAMETFERLDVCPGLAVGSFASVTGLHGSPAVNTFQLFDTDMNGLVDVHEVFAAMVLCCKGMPMARVRLLFEVYDLDKDRSLSEAECVIMLRSVLLAVCKITGGLEPSTAAMEDLVRHIFHVVDSSHDQQISYTEWLIFCGKTPEVSRIGAMLDFTKGPGRKALASGTAVKLPPGGLKLGNGEEDPAADAQNGADTQGATRGGPQSGRQHAPRGGGSGHRPRRGGRRGRPSYGGGGRGGASGGGKSKYAKSSVMRIKELFDSIDRDGSGYVDEAEWRKHTSNTALGNGNAGGTFSSLDHNHDGKISIVEVLQEVYPYANDQDLTTMLEWVSDKAPPKLERKRNLTAAEGREMLALFNMYDRDGNGELTVQELSEAMAENVGLSRDDITAMFRDVHNRDSISAEEFSNIFIAFMAGDIGIQGLMRRELRDSYPSII